jgi:hypothetical protein
LLGWMNVFCTCDRLKVATMVAKSIPSAITGKRLYSLYRTDFKFVSLGLMLSETVCFAFTIKLFLCKRGKKTSFIAGWWDAFAMQPTKMIHGFRSHRHHTVWKMDISYCMMAKAKSFHSAE